MARSQTVAARETRPALLDVDLQHAGILPGAPSKVALVSPKGVWAKQRRGPKVVRMTLIARSPRSLPLAIVAAAVAVLFSAGAADARTYTGQPAGGAILLKVNRGHLRQIATRLPAGCENNHGGHWRSTLQINLSGDLQLQAGRFSLQGRAPNQVRYAMSGRLRRGTISGRIRLTYLDLDYVGVDDSYLCDTGSLRIRAR
jgi:hypothetical protein